MCFLMEDFVVYFPYPIIMEKGMQSEINRLYSMNLLDKLLCDKTTGKNIIWATDAYNSATPPYRCYLLNVSEIER